MLEKYLERIGVADEDIRVDVPTLKRLQRQHLLSVPFENLDIHGQRPIILDAGKFFNKVVDERRGGFCYELNGLFNELLREIGYETQLVAARVHMGDGRFGPEYDHAAIIVTIGGEEYLADVGFGDFAAEPLRLITDVEQDDREGTFVIRNSTEAGYLGVAKKAVEEWVPEYIFKPESRDLSEFIEMCDYQQYSPESHFTKKKVCSILTADGRKTLSDRKFIVTVNGEKTETVVDTDEEFERLLMKEFGISPSPRRYATQDYDKANFICRRRRLDR